MFFDNLQSLSRFFGISHNRGRIIKENHYYAYGLKIAALSSKKLGDVNEGQLKNQHLYNDKELWEEADLNWYDYGFRNYDAQIGRFPQLDPLNDYYPKYSPFQYAGCEPIANTDIDGLEPFNVVQTLADVTITTTRSAASIGSSMASQIINIGARLAINITPGIIENGNTSDYNVYNVSNQNNKPRMFIYPVLQSLTPGIYAHITDAITKKGKPFLLTYDSDKQEQIKRRNSVCPPGNPRPAGLSCDEYPFASTEEGGINNGSSASTRMVPIREQSFQGGTISILKTVFGMKDGDKIFVVPISEEYEKSFSSKKVPEKNVEPWYEGLGKILEKLIQRFTPPIIVPPFSPNDPMLQPFPRGGWQPSL